WEPEGRLNRGRLSLLTFFGEAKKVSGPPGPVPASIHEEQPAQNHRRKNPQKLLQKSTIPP
ncbi:hypothetical protein, partial [Noviherbaspirillum sp. Root189]|uniref:hypothetical protein n=1 Tax=Noviherbaspirillum sp. Root189 TaxID=1736487 RepID=UPI001F43C9D7